ncbi:hypothetical protein [Streptomyces cinereoruber]|uniref:hypothetical protein n=1 Tax=Streptomyces cinereoruber TaxID=67260 RepID=UPI00363B542E
MGEQFVLTYSWSDGQSGKHTCNTRADAETLRRQMVAHAASTGKKVTIGIARQPQPGGHQAPGLAARPTGSHKPSGAFVAGIIAIVAVILIVANMGGQDSEPYAPTTPKNREECERAYEGVGDGTVDWRGICPVMHP